MTTTRIKAFNASMEKDHSMDKYKIAVGVPGDIANPLTRRKIKHTFLSLWRCQVWPAGDDYDNPSGKEMTEVSIPPGAVKLSKLNNKYHFIECHCPDFMYSGDVCIHKLYVCHQLGVYDLKKASYAIK